MESITVEASVENISVVTAFVDRQLEALDCPMKAQTQIDIAIDELFGNIARYAYTPDTGMATVQFEALQEPNAVRITFIDEGKPYNPLQAKDPDTTLSAEDREIGGLGIFLVKKIIDELVYRHTSGHNTLSIKKLL